MSGLSGEKVTVDALHTNSKTVSLINLNGGSFITQVKANQPILLSICQQIGESEEAFKQLYSFDSGHGRIEKRYTSIFNFEGVELDSRWIDSGFRTLVVVTRQTKITKSGQERGSISYYLSNQEAEDATELFRAIRGHWQVESNNYCASRPLGGSARCDLR